jgi:SAM-dependent methyltransferase
MIVEDRAGKQFWDDLWNGAELPSAADPSRAGLSNLFIRRIDTWYRDFFAPKTTRGQLFLEVGCGSSIWLPYFAKRFGFEVFGIDYSEEGCRKEESILARAGVQGQVICADFFDPPKELLGKFDYVYSGGVAEHFWPTSKCIQAFSRFLQPGGIMITSIPNLAGVVGILQKWADQSVYDIHVPLDTVALRSAHEAAELTVLSSDYFLSSGFGLINVAERTGNWTRLKMVLIRVLEGASVVCWAVEDRIVKIPETRWFSPYIICVAQKGT